MLANYQRIFFLDLQKEVPKVPKVPGVPKVDNQFFFNFRHSKL
jgi:hypothetical protein